MAYALNERAKRLVNRNKPPLFLKHQILGMLTNWSQRHHKKGLRTLQGRFIKIKISHADLAVMSYLLLDFMNQDTGLCLPTQETIADRIGYSRNTVNKAVKKWRLLGVLGIVRRKCLKPSTGINHALNTSLFYHLTKNLYKRLKHALETKYSFLLDLCIDSKKLNIKYQKKYNKINTISSFDNDIHNRNINNDLKPPEIETELIIQNDDFKKMPISASLLAFRLARNRGVI